jgi:flagellar export protein FliJ
MKFKFRLETLMRHRKVLQDEAQRDYLIAQKNVQDQMARIKEMYSELDSARLRAEQIQLQGGNCSAELMHIDDYIQGQKTRIHLARQKARELMQIAEEKHEVLTEKSKDHKMLEKLKEQKKLEFKKMKNKMAQAEVDDMAIMRYDAEKTEAV